MRGQQRYAGKEVWQKSLQCKRKRNAGYRQHGHKTCHRDAKRSGNDYDCDRPQHGLYRAAEKRLEARVDVAAWVKDLLKRLAQNFYRNIAENIDYQRRENGTERHIAELYRWKWVEEIHALTQLQRTAGAETEGRLHFGFVFREVFRGH